MPEHDYRVLSPRARAATGGKLLHLVREDAESSLCGIPRSVLMEPELDPLVCADCVEGLLKRRMISGAFQPVSRPQRIRLADFCHFPARSPFRPSPSWHPPSPSRSV